MRPVVGASPLNPPFKVSPEAYVGQVTRIRYPDNTSEYFGYNAAEEPVWRYGQDGRTTTLLRDSLHRVYRVEHPQTPAYPAFVVEVQHDEFGRVTQIQDYNGVSSAGYDDLNRLVNWNPAVGRGVTYSFQRDLGLQRWITNVNLSGIGVYQLGEDPESLRGRREGADRPGPEPVRADGDHALRPGREAGPPPVRGVNVDRANGTYSLYSYTSRDWLAAIEHKLANGAALDTFQYRVNGSPLGHYGAAPCSTAAGACAGGRCRA